MEGAVAVSAWPGVQASRDAVSWCCEGEPAWTRRRRRGGGCEAALSSRLTRSRCTFELPCSSSRTAGSLACKRESSPRRRERTLALPRRGVRARSSLARTADDEVQQRISHVPREHAREGNVCLLKVEGVSHRRVGEGGTRREVPDAAKQTSTGSTVRRVSEEGEGASTGTTGGRTRSEGGTGAAERTALARRGGTSTGGEGRGVLEVATWVVGR